MCWQKGGIPTIYCPGQTGWSIAWKGQENSKWWSLALRQTEKATEEKIKTLQIKATFLKSESILVDEISHLPPQSQAEAIADSSSAISNEYEKINKDDINTPYFEQSSIPQLKQNIVMRYLKNIKTN